MLYLKLLLPSLLLLANSISNNTNNCDLTGNWAQVTQVIYPNGDTYNLTFYEEVLTEEDFLKYAKAIHFTYFSGQGYIDIHQSPTLSLTKKKLTYKGQKVGKYRISKDCKTIDLINTKIQNDAATYATCTVLYRYENIIAMKQGTETVFYLQRDSKNPYFVGD